MTDTLIATRRAALTLTCVKCTRYRRFEAETSEAAGREAERKGWALINGKTYCNHCPHPFKAKSSAPPPPAPESPIAQLPTRMESSDEIIARLVRDGLLIKNAQGLVTMSPQARQMQKADMARLLRPRGI